MMTQEHRLPIVREGIEDVPILFANDFIAQFRGTEFILTVGQLQPPIIFGSAEERQEQLDKTGYVPVQVVARLGLTEQRMGQLIEVLNQNWEKYQQQKGTEETDG